MARETFSFLCIVAILVFPDLPVFAKANLIEPVENDCPGSTSGEATGATFPECGIIYHLGDFATGPGQTPLTDPGTSSASFAPGLDYTLDGKDLAMLREYLDVDGFPVSCWQLITMDVAMPYGSIGWEDLATLEAVVKEVQENGGDPGHTAFKGSLFIGDANTDGHVIVDIASAFSEDEEFGPEDDDLYLIQQHIDGSIRLSDQGVLNADFDGNGVVDSNDLVNIADCYGAKPGSPSGPQPVID